MKVLVSDFDKTFYTKDFKKNIDLVNKFVDDGNVFVIATGRNINLLKKDIEGLGIKYSYLICNDGALICDHNFKVLNKTDLDYKYVKPILDIMNESSVIDEAYIDDGCNLVKKSEFANAIAGKFNDYGQATFLLKEIEDNFVDVHGYLSTNWLIINNSKTSKALAIHYLISQNKFKKDDIIVVGDHTNDVSMYLDFEGYAIEDSIIKIKKLAKKQVKDFKGVIRSLNLNKS